MQLDIGDGVGRLLQGVGARGLASMSEPTLVDALTETMASRDAGGTDIAQQAPRPPATSMMS